MAASFGIQECPMSPEPSRSSRSVEPETSQPARWNAPQSQVAEAAYYIWEKEGRPGGRELDHWLRAEHEVRKLVNVGAIREHNS
jgi:hypothetical protein